MKNQLVALSFMLITAAHCFSQTESVTFVNPSTVAKPKGYSTAAHIDLGNSTMIVISGLVSLDKEGNLTGKGDIAKQLEQIFMNMKYIVEDAGGTMSDVVKLGVYFIDISQIQIFRDIRDKYVNTAHPPTSTAMQVSKLARDEFLVEIEATAVVKKR